MAKLVVALLLVGGLGAAAALVPLGGRTVVDRWRSAHGAADFVERGWAEARGALLGAPAKVPARPPARTRPPRAARAPERPSEHHSEADRAALDRLVSGLK